MLILQEFASIPLETTNKTGLLQKMEYVKQGAACHCHLYFFICINDQPL
jgi:hypothetical protein